MHQPERLRMQRVTTDQRRIGRTNRSVDTIPEDRMAAGREVDADLMGPARFGRSFDERRARETLEDADTRHRRAPAANPQP